MIRTITYDDTLYQLVPKEPTLNMHKAYRDVLAIGSELDAAMVYRSMLSAAPTPPAQPAERVPLTPDQLADRCERWLNIGVPATNIVDAFESGFRDAELVNGITAPKEPS